MLILRTKFNSFNKIILNGVSNMLKCNKYNICQTIKDIKGRGGNLVNVISVSGCIGIWQWYQHFFWVSNQLDGVS